jgi:hypothetical protein
MMLAVFTGRINVRDPDLLDITRAGANRARRAGEPAVGEFLAPSDRILWPLKDACKNLLTSLLEGKISEAEHSARAEELGHGYEADYTEEMRRSYRERRGEWRALLARPRVVLGCYCPDAEHCHRGIAARILAKCGAQHRGEVATIRAISIRQPWAWAILNAGKTIENRGAGWKNTAPGPALLHAAKGCTRVEYDTAAAFIRDITGARPPPLGELPRGGVVGTAIIRGVIAGVVPESIDPWFVGPVGLKLAHVTACAFAPCAGALGFFPVSEELLAREGAFVVPG